MIAGRTVSEMTYNVSSGTLNLTHSLYHSVVDMFCVVIQSRLSSAYILCHVCGSDYVINK